MRRAARIDDNQREIVDVLRAAGCSVQSLAAVGCGCPDLLVGRAGKCFLLEIKDGSKPPSARQLTEDQKKWHRSWSGHAAVVETAAEALLAVRLSSGG